VPVTRLLIAASKPRKNKRGIRKQLSQQCGYKKKKKKKGPGQKRLKSLHEGALVLGGGKTKKRTRGGGGAGRAGNNWRGKAKKKYKKLYRTVGSHRKYHVEVGGGRNTLEQGQGGMKAEKKMNGFRQKACWVVDINQRGEESQVGQKKRKKKKKLKWGQVIDVMPEKSRVVMGNELEKNGKK